MSTLPTGTVTFLFTDLEGSAQLWEQHPNEMCVDLARHNALIGAAIAENEGHVFHTAGDSFCAAFATAQNGVRTALRTQQALQAEPWAVGGAGLRARMALHTGEAQERDGDYFGPALNRAGRLRDVAHGGQTVLSQATELLVRGSLPAGAWLRDLGPHRLRDLSRPEQVFQLYHPDLPGEFPPLRSLDRFPHNLPQRLDSFIGRERDLAHVKRRLLSTRLLTLTGVGGAGKTRLAQQAAAESLDRYPDGVWLVPLEALADPALVPQALAAAVGAREQPGHSLTATLCETLRGQRLLILLDNCEHLIAACAHLVQTLLQSCPHVQILATSREPLAISGEATFPVPTLPQAVPSPPSGDLEEPSDAVRLFVDRAALSLSSFTLTPQNAPAVARICRQLDGIPLAIELAAPRVKMLTPEQISQRLDNRFRLLTGGSRTALPRQQTMQAAIQWSHDLLSEPERGLFRRLSVFAGGWTLEAAEWVCSGDGLDEWDVMDLLSSLVAKSLVQSDEDGDCEHRYRMLETLRQYSWEQLHASPGFEAVRDRHRDWFLRLAEQAEAELRGPQQGVWLDRLEAEHDNLRAALGWATPEVRLRLAAALQRFWLTRGYLSEGRGWLDVPLMGDTEVSPLVLAGGLSAAGFLAWAQADYHIAHTLHMKALTLYRQQQHTPGVALSLKNLGIVSDYQEDYLNARRYYEESLALCRGLGDPWDTSAVLLNLGAHLIGQGQPQAALPFLQECLAGYQALHDQLATAMVLYNLGQVMYQQKELDKARSYLLESLAIRRSQQDQRGLASSLFHLSCVTQAMGDTEIALALLFGAEQISKSIGVPLSVADRQEYHQLTMRLREEAGVETFEAAERQSGQEDAAQIITKVLGK